MLLCFLRQQVSAAFVLKKRAWVPPLRCGHMYQNDADCNTATGADFRVLLQHVDSI